MAEDITARWYTCTYSSKGWKSPANVSWNFFLWNEDGNQFLLVSNYISHLKASLKRFPLNARWRIRIQAVTKANLWLQTAMTKATLFAWMVHLILFPVLMTLRCFWHKQGIDFHNAFFLMFIDYSLWRSWWMSDPSWEVQGGHKLWMV